jgi:hypothetical protein
VRARDPADIKVQPSCVCSSFFFCWPCLHSRANTSCVFTLCLHLTLWAGVATKVFQNDSFASAPKHTNETENWVVRMFRTNAWRTHSRPWRMNIDKLVLARVRLTA